MKFDWHFWQDLVFVHSMLHGPVITVFPVRRWRLFHPFIVFSWYFIELLWCPFTQRLAALPSFPSVFVCVLPLFNLLKCWKRLPYFPTWWEFLRLHISSIISLMIFRPDSVVPLSFSTIFLRWCWHCSCPCCLRSICLFRCFLVRTDGWYCSFVHFRLPFIIMI